MIYREMLELDRRSQLVVTSANTRGGTLSFNDIQGDVGAGQKVAAGGNISKYMRRYTLIQWLMLPPAATFCPAPTSPCISLNESVPPRVFADVTTSCDLLS